VGIDLKEKVSNHRKLPLKGLAIVLILLVLVAGVLVGLSVTKPGGFMNPENPEGLSTVDGYYFVGLIDNRYPIQLKLEFNLRNSLERGKEVEVSGDYFYDNKASSGRLDLTGTYNIQSRKLMLREWTGHDKETGAFSGVLSPDGQVVGEWTSRDGKRRLPFKLSRVCKSVTWTDYVPPAEQKVKTKESIVKGDQNGGDEGYQIINCIVFDDPSMRDAFYSQHKDCRGFEKVNDLHFPFPDPAGKDHTITSSELNYYSDRTIGISTNEYSYEAGNPHGSNDSGWEIFVKGRGLAGWRKMNSWKDLFNDSEQCNEEINGLIYKHLGNASGNSCDKPDEYKDSLVDPDIIELKPATIRFYYPGGTLGPYICSYHSEVSYDELKACIPEQSPLRRFVH
jgi:hypothetical protein